jgi:hypothetical protein
MKATIGKRPAMSLHRDILKRNKLVYLVVAPRPIPRRNGKSRIAYIGTTKKGAKRIAPSAAARTEDVFDLRGFRRLDVYIVSCKAKPGKVAWWRILERALLAKFFERYWQHPLCNKKGPRAWKDRWSKFFREDRIRNILLAFDGSHH